MTEASDRMECPECGAEIDVGELQTHHVRERLEVEMRSEFEQRMDEQVTSALQKRDEEQQAELDANKEIIEEMRVSLKAAKKAEFERDQLKLEMDDQVKNAEVRASAAARRATLAEIDDIVVSKVEIGLAEKDTELEKMRLKNERLEARVDEAVRQNRSVGGEIEGEALELVIQNRLEADYPLDDINQIKRGRKGADILQGVVDIRGNLGEKILWEVKAHERWQDEWMAKVRQDAIDQRASVKVIVSRVLPEGIERFDCVDDIFICRPHEVLIAARLLREMCIRVRNEQHAQAHLMDIQQQVVEYIRSKEFESAMNAVAEAYREIGQNNRLIREYIVSKTKTQEKHLTRVLDAMASVIGTMQAIGAADEFPITRLLEEPSEDDIEEEDGDADDE